MDKLTNDLKGKFSEFDYFRLFEIVYLPENKQCEITLMYPYIKEDLTDDNRKKITDFLIGYFKLNADIKLKLKKSYLDENLIIKKVTEFLKINHKSIFSHFEKEDISSNYTDLNCNIKLKLAKEVKDYFDENKIVAEMEKFLRKNFYANFEIETILEKNKIIADEIELPYNFTQKQKTKRYKVEIIKEVVGNNILPNPQFISGINSPISSCLIAGKISKIQKGDFKPKKPKTEDEIKHFYSFTIDDGQGKMPCIYFSSKTAEKIMDLLEEGFYLLLNGDIRKGMNEKLTMYIKRIAFASKIETIEDEEKCDFNYDEINDYLCVNPENLLNDKQECLFGDLVEYNRNVKENVFVVFDCETTGLDYMSCEIIELAACKIVNGNIVEKFQSLVKPNKEIPELITNITSITNEMVRNAPKIEDVIVDFLRFSKGTVLSGYNVEFDMRFVRNAASALGLCFENSVQDVMAMVRTSGLKIGNMKLVTVVKALNIDLKNAHRAYNDAYATALVLLKLNQLKKD